MTAAVLALPPAIASGWERPPSGTEPLWLIALFTVSIGLPFFALAANSPLLQAWFARTDHPAAGDPYFLYAASNVGSFLALVSYPTLIEPFVRLADQARFWSVGFCLLIVLLIACGVLLWRSPGAASTADDVTPARPTWKDAVSWVALAAVPAGLLIAVTAHISTDVAAVPLLWVLPLALYLLTFVIAFARRPIIPHWLVVALQPPFVVALIAVIIFDPLKTIIWVVAMHLTVFFVNALMCHGELARTRPPARYLTAFYLCISAGGVIGGVTTGLIAPHVFNWVAEYPILIALAVLCRPGLALPIDRSRRYMLFGGLAAAVGVLVLCALYPVMVDAIPYNWALGTLLAAAALLWRAPLPFYYWDGSAIAQALEAVRARVDGPIRFAVIGLGAGALACRAAPGDTVHYYEIDPAIVSIARDPYLFSFLWVCRPDVPVILGDARLTPADAPGRAYHL